MVIHFNISKVKEGFYRGRKANTTIELMKMSPKNKWLYESRMKYKHNKASCIKVDETKEL